MLQTKLASNYPDLFDRLFHSDILNGSNKHYSKTNTSIPLVNVSEKDDGFTIEMAIPGFKKEDFKIELNNGKLTISSEKKENNKSVNNDNYTLKEYSYQSFSRSFTLTDTLEQDQVTASYKDGILTLFIPKKEEAKPKPIQLIEVT
ncbi:Hsp20/alpha crystallin family protein [Wenyingzhuangia sp. 1_MG-2023]|nr:Hsp20/alpha crystallin family protein [Wenyingzhuangia sp. 1_MG-2023]